MMVSQSCLTHKILLGVFNLGVPQQNHQLSDRVPGLQQVRRNKVVNSERHQLSKTLEVLANQTPLVAADVLGVHRRRVEAVGTEGLKTHSEHVHRLRLVDQQDRLAPVVLDDAEKNRVQDLGRCVEVYIDA